MATKTPLDGDVTERRKQAVKEKLQYSKLALRHRLGLFGLLLMVLLPTVLRPLELNQFTTVFFLIMFAISWDVVSGYTGQLSFGHAFFFALGGYGTAVITNQHELPIVAGILGATAIAAIGGVLIGVPALRLEGPYLSLVTLIAPLLLSQLFILFSEPGDLPLAPEGLGGTSGLVEAPPQIVGFAGDAVITTQSNMMWSIGRYYTAFLAMLVVLIVCYAVTRSSAGSVFTAIREDEDAVRSSGLNPAKFKIFAFVLSGAVGGFAAAMWMHVGGFPNVENLFGAGNGLERSITTITMVIIGGMGTIVGPVVGAVVFALADAVIAGLEVPVPGLSLEIADLNPLPTFLFAMLVLVYMPRGVAPEAIDRGRRYLARRRGEEVPKRDTGGRSAARSVIEKYRDEIDEILGRDNK